MMMTEKMIALMINLLLGQITESSTRMRERLKNCDSDKANHDNTTGYRSPKPNINQATHRPINS